MMTYLLLAQFSYYVIVTIWCKNEVRQLTPDVSINWYEANCHVKNYCIALCNDFMKDINNNLHDASKQLVDMASNGLDKIV